MVNPCYFGFLTDKRDSQGAATNGIASSLDQNGYGSILDDVAGFFY